MKKELNHVIIILDMEKQYTAILTDEADEQLLELSAEDRETILEAIKAFELIGREYKNLNTLGDKLFEIKPKGVRAYFMYHPTLRKIIIVGFVCLKTTKKAPPRYMEQARRNIAKYLEQEAQNGKNT